MFLFSPTSTQEDYSASTHQESFKSQRVWFPNTMETDPNIAL